MMEIKEKQFKKQIINRIKKQAKTYFERACPSHDWTHVERVYDLCLYIGEKEKANLEVLKLAALLHDTGRKEEMNSPDNLDHAQISSDIASDILKKYDVDKKTKEHVLNCIESHRFRKNKKPETLEAKILFDADKLDCIGAIGIARAYAWAGKQGIKLYSDKDYLGTGYEKQHSPITEFAYKLSKVKDRLFTDTAKKIAEQRHNYMEDFFKQLNQELKK
jgi:uncharacterized protein